MKSIEFQVVLEDDDGKTYVRTYRSGDPRIARRLDEAVRDAILDEDPEARGLSSVGPVMRRSTTFRGSYGSIHGEFYIGRGPGPCAITLRDLVPEIGGGVHDVMVDITVAPVKEKQS